MNSLYGLYRLSKGSAIVALFLLSAYLIIGAAAVRYIHDYQEPLRRELVRLSGLDIQWQNASGQWQGLSPHIVLSDLRIASQPSTEADAGAEPALRISHLHLALSPLRSLFTLAPRLDHVQVDTLHFSIQESGEGAWSFAGLAIAQEQAEDSENSVDLIATVADVLLGLDALNIEHTELRLDLAGQAPAHLDFRDVQIERQFQFRRFQAQVSLNGGKGISLLSELKGDPRTRISRSASYLKFQHADLKPLVTLVPPQWQSLFASPLSGEMWLKSRPGWRGEFIAEFSSAEVSMTGLAGKASASVEPVRDVHASIHGHFNPQQWQADFSRIDLNWQGQTLDLSGLRMGQSMATPLLLDFSIPSIDLAFFDAFFKGLQVLPEEVNQVIDSLRPRGYLRRVQATVPLAPEVVSALLVRGEMDNISVQPWYGAPGAKGIDGYIETGLDKGMVMVAGRDVDLSFPKLYERPLALASLNTQIGWEIGSSRLRLDSDVVSARTDKGVHLDALLSLDIPLQREADDAPSMTLMIGAEDLPLKDREDFIPSNFSPELQAWLRQSIQGGVARSVGFIFRGAMRGDDDASRTVQMFFDVADTQLNYHSDWPALTTDAAQIVIDGRNTFAWAAQASTLSATPLNDVQVAVLAGTKNGPGTRVLVNAQANPPLEDALRLVRESPLKKTLAPAFHGWSGEGVLPLQLDMDIALSSEEDSRFALSAKARLDHLDLGGMRLRLEELRGQFSYRDDGSKLANLSGLLEGKLFNQAISGQLSTDKDGLMSLSATTLVAAADIADWLDLSLLEVFEGEAEMAMSLRLNGDYPALDLRSDMRGIAQNLPAPFYKPAEQAAAMHIHMPMQSQSTIHGPLREMRIELQGLGSMRLGMGADDSASSGIAAAELVLAERGEIATLSEGDTWLQKSGIGVSGQVSSANLAEWQALLSKTVERQSIRDRAKAQAGETDAGKGFLLYLEDLQIAALQIGELQLHQLGISGGNGAIGGEEWRFGLRSDLADGVVVLPSSEADVLTLQLSQLRLPAAQTETAKASAVSGAVPGVKSGRETGKAASALSALLPSDLPNVDVDIADLRIGEKSWGSLGFDLRSNDVGAEFRRLRGVMRGVRLEAEADNRLWWLNGVEPSAATTTGLRAVLALDDAGKALSAWGYEGLVQKGRGDIALSLGWDGAPDEFALNKVAGQLGLDIENGSLTAIPEAAAGASKVVGIFNFSELLRRLKFDFRDIAAKGLSFDTLDGQLHFNAGHMRIAEPLVIKGSASRFDLVGSADLNTTILDMEMVSTLPISKNLPWFAALIGGVPTAAGVFIASKVLEKEMNKFSSGVYSITGSWREPEVKFVRLFDDEVRKELSKSMAEATATPEKGGTAAETQAGAANDTQEAAGGE